MKPSKNRIPVIAGILASVCAVACVNEDYDLNKGIDGTVDINGDISAPIGDTEKIMLGDFLNLSGENSIILVDNDGNYVLSISSQQLNERLGLPQVDLTGVTIGSEENPCGFRATYSVPSLGNSASSLIPQHTFNFGGDGKVLRSSMNVSGESVPESVVSVHEATLDATIEIKLKITRSDGGSNAAITVAKGMKIYFPEYFTIGKADASDARYTIDNSTVITAQDITLTPDSPVSLFVKLTKINFDGMPEGQGLVNGKINIDDSIDMSDFSATALASNFGSVIGDIPQSIIFDVDMFTTDISLHTLKLVFNPEISVENQSIEITDIPEFLSGEDVNLDFWNPVLRLNLGNDSPLPLLLSADIIAYSSAQETARIHIGSTDAQSTDAVVIKEGENIISISRREVDAPEVAPDVNYIPLVKDEFVSLISGVPDRIELANLEISVLQEPIVLDLRKTDPFVFAFDYTLSAPFAFDEKLYISYTYDVKNMNSVFNSSSSGEDGGNGYEIHLSEGTVYLTFNNEIPLDMLVTASPIDVDGNVIESGIEVALVPAGGTGDLSVAGGRIGSPTMTPAEIHLTATVQALKKFDGFALNFNAECSGSNFAEPLNTNQSIRLTDISVSIKGGVTTQLF